MPAGVHIFTNVEDAAKNVDIAVMVRQQHRATLPATIRCLLSPAALPL
jgi:hypothetical protein